jgi:hypothetical protein
MLYNKIKMILNSIENNIETKKHIKINKLRIIFMLKPYNIKDVNDINYDIYFDINNDEEFDMIVKHFKKEGYKCKDKKFQSYNYLKIKMKKDHDNCNIF